jgi:hypothetical protein
MLIYSEYDHPRFQYAAEMLLIHSSNKVIFTNDHIEFEKHPGPKFSYGKTISGLHFEADDSIWNNEVKFPSVEIVQSEGLTRLLFGGNKQFDVFAATFFMLSRMEEYQPNVLDHHGRFKSSSSVLFSDKNYQVPVVDLWRDEFQRKLIQFYPEISFESSSFELQPTIDVDSAFAYKHKGFKRTFGGFVKDIISLNLKNAKQRFLCVLGFKKDPYDTYDYASRTAQSCGVQINWFFLLSDFSRENINLPHTSESLIGLIRSLHQQHHIGIHPGYHRSNIDVELKKEIDRLKHIIGVPVKRSRQHYLRMSLPNTYRLLLHENVEHDYTMGFADDVGYRAGTAIPFPWFDLKTNIATQLMVHPFVLMDTTLKNYLHLDPENAIRLVQKMKTQCMDMNLPFCFLWHNESLSEHHSWIGWSKVWSACFIE